MSIPQANYVVDNQGEKLFAQLNWQDWENFVEEFKRMENLVFMKNKLKNAFREIRQIQNDEKSATTLTEFLDEL